MRDATRREFLKRACAIGGLGVGAGFAADLMRLNAFAADTGGYKALVCLFLFGGMDCHDTVIPADVDSFAEYRAIRQPLLDGYAVSRDRANLLTLDGADLGGRTFGLGQEMTPLHELWLDGKMSVVGNVGPLVEPTTRTTYMAGSVRLPPRLFSHNDQQSVWMANSPEGARLGWGGRFADQMIAAGANPSATFTAVSAAGATVFLTGQTARSFQVNSNGAVNISATSGATFQGSPDLPAILEDHYRDTDGSIASLFGRDMVDVTRFSLDSNDTLSDALAGALPLVTPFPASSLGSQLSIVARLISQRSPLGANRQIFFVSTGGYDTHSGQAATLPGLQAGIAAAMRAFYDATVEMGLASDVTLFTASDFGRTLTVNGDGTDHGWGAHHFVVGGGVQGGRILGDIPPPAVDHAQDSGRGRIIPSVAVDQYAAALGGWFGLSPSELTEALPQLGAFDPAALNGLFAASSA